MDSKKVASAILDVAKNVGYVVLAVVVDEQSRPEDVEMLVDQFSWHPLTRVVSIGAAVEGIDVPHWMSSLSASCSLCRNKLGMITTEYSEPAYCQYCFDEVSSESQSARESLEKCEQRVWELEAILAEYKNQLYRIKRELMGD